MSRSSRKRSSKWDLAEEPQFEDANVDDGWMGKSGRPFHHKESGREWLSPELAVSNGSKWSGLETNDMQRSKHDLGVPSREPLPGSRGSHKNESINKGSNRYVDNSMVWNEDGSCSTRMSPGLDEWRQHRSRSPKSGWRSLRGRSRSRSRSRSWSRSRSRSRSPSWSRSPDRGYRRESLFLDRNRSRSGISAHLCKDFSAGRCRRGSDCHFLHEGNSNYDDSWESRHRKGGAPRYSTPPDTGDYPLKSGRSSVYCNDFAKGKCRRGASCKFDHHRASDGFSKGSANETIRERENGRRKRDASVDRGAEREPRRSSDIPCKFFAAGNCRNKKYCRFSHHIQARVSPERKSRDGRWGLGHDLNDADQGWDGPKWSDTVTLSDAAKLSADNNGNICVPELRSGAWSMNDNRWGHGLNNENQICDDPSVSHEAIKRKEKEAHLLKEDNVGARVGLPKSRDTDKWLGDMSPDWNYTVQSSNHVGKEEHNHITRGSESSRLNDTSLNTCKQDIIREASGQLHGGASFMHPMIAERSNFMQNMDLMEEGAIALPHDDKIGIEKTASSRTDPSVSTNIMPCQSFDRNGQTSSTYPFSGLSTIGQSQTLIPTHPQGGGIVKIPQDTLSPERKSVIKLDIGDSKTSLLTGIPPVPNDVGGKDFTQLTNLSASLAQLFGNRQQLPQLYAALNSQNAMNTPFSESEGFLEQLSAEAIQPDPAMLSQKPYDPICDSIELKKLELSNNPMCLLPNSTGKTSVDGKVEKPSKSLSPSFPSRPNGDDYDQTHISAEEPKNKSHQLSQLEPGAKSEVVKGNNELRAEEGKKAQEEINSPENVPLEDVDKDGTDEGRKLKDVKGIRAFKFSLVEFVKELLKPTWKEGQINKDAYKTIVKKVVDKVTRTMQGANIPQTQEKIDQYLSFSKPKLTKLVQAYVEKMQKG